MRLTISILFFIKSLQQDDAICVSHEFISKHYWRPTFCDHDGTLITGLIHQGLHCKSKICQLYNEIYSLLIIYIINFRLSDGYSSMLS